MARLGQGAAEIDGDGKFSDVRKAMAGMENMMERTNLADGESTKLVVDDTKEDGGAPVWVVIGKIPHRRVLHFNTIVEALRPVRGNPTVLTFSSVGDNMFVAHLEGQRDRGRIWEGSPLMAGKHAGGVRDFFMLDQSHLV